MIAALAKTALFTILVPGAVLVYVPYRLLGKRFAIPLDSHWVVGLPLIVLGAVVYLRCAWDFATAGRGTPAIVDPPKDLVVRGFYRHVRNPMYVAVVTVLVGEALLFRSLRLLEYATIVFLFFFAFVILYEEPALRGKFGESYERYRRDVPRWLPRLPRRR